MNYVMKTAFSIAALTLAGCKLTVDIPVEGGSVTSNTSINCPSICSESLHKNTTVTLSATSNPGFFFGRWEGCDRVDDNECTVETKNTVSTRNIKAHFVKNVAIGAVELSSGLKERCVFSSDNWGVTASNETPISDVTFVSCVGGERWYDDVEVKVRITNFDTSQDINGELVRNCTVDIQNPRNGKTVSVAATYQSVSDAFGIDEGRRLCNWHVNGEITTLNNRPRSSFRPPSLRNSSQFSCV